MQYKSFSLTLLAFATSFSQAQETIVDDPTISDIERVEIVGTPSRFGATKTNIPIAETPRSVSIVTSDEFLERGALALSNTVNYTAGVTGNAFGAATRNDTFSIRGLDAPEYQDNLQVQFDFLTTQELMYIPLNKLKYSKDLLRYYMDKRPQAVLLVL